jgi:hypothetical protein
MQRYIALVAIGMTIIVGCAARTPVAPETGNPGMQALGGEVAVNESPHRLWGEWTLYFNAAHDRVDFAPRREAKFHLNALKFLESYCTDCLKITSIHNNGDGTINLTLSITHPFEGHPEYTGFDVKGIIMFQGSHEIPENMAKMPLYPQNYHLSWRLMGDPELLNADGYTYLWSPWYDSGSTMPIFKYWPGKYASGTPSANVNGYLNFYSSENRHMFETGKTVSRTYHISLPPGPVTAGYAIDACWEPPTVTPVSDPAKDFPFSANQPELYHFKIVINDGVMPLTTGCCLNITVHEARAEVDDWYRLPTAFEGNIVGIWNEDILWSKAGTALWFECDNVPDHPDDWGCLSDYPLSSHPNGEYQIFAYEYHDSIPPPKHKVLYPAFDVVKVTIDN